MKRLCIVILTMISINLCAQKGEYNFNYMFYTNFESDLAYRVPGSSIKDKTVNIQISKPGKKKIKEHKKEYDKNGKMTRFWRISDGKEELLTLNKFDNNSELLSHKSYKNGKLKRGSELERNAKGKLIKLERFGKENQLRTTKVWNYNEEGCLMGSTYENAKGKLKRKWDYEYYEECKKKKSTLSNGKGKILKVWTYECKQEGEILQKKKDVTQYCEWEEADQEYLMTITQSLDEKGRIYKRISKYRAKDTALVSIKRYNKDDELIYDQQFDFSAFKPLSSTGYKKGKERHKTVFTYNSNNLASYTYSRKGKTRYKAEYSYDAEDQLTAMQSFNKKGELSKVMKLEYN